eukprot:s1380_g7.t1
MRLNRAAATMNHTITCLSDATSGNVEGTARVLNISQPLGPGGSKTKKAQTLPTTPSDNDSAPPFVVGSVEAPKLMDCGRLQRLSSGITGLLKD